jgi:putative ABC transport system permease protein
MIFLVVRYELSYDSFHSKAERIYRVNSIMLPGNYPTTGAPMPVAQAMKADFPEVEQATTTVFFDDGLVKINDQVYKEKGITYVAPQYFEILDAQWLAGNPQKALSEPNSVVLTRSLAQKYFGGTASTIAQTTLGKTITINVEHTVRVTGILEDLPPNTDLPFKILISFASLKAHFPNWDLTDWTSINGNTTHFLLLREGHRPCPTAEEISGFRY